MSEELTETLQLKLVNPNAHKQRKLRETVNEYQLALHDAFDNDCDTQTKTNDVVVNYDLSGYAKNALKQYVPKLLDENTYDANELKEETHPVRFTNEGPSLDHKPQNAIEWYVKIPHHEDYHLWLPAQPPANKRDWLEALYHGDAEMGECQLIERDGEWYVHMSVTREVEQPSSVSAEEQTPVGVDIGEAALATVCHRDERGTPTTPNIWSDESREVRNLRKTYFTATHRLQQREAERLDEEYGDELWARIDHLIDKVSQEVVAHVQAVENPVLVLEDLQHLREEMDYGRFMNRRLHGWAFAKLHAQIQYKAAERGIPVDTVEPAYTSKTCHACGEEGYRPRQGTFKCTNDECWVSEYQADINAALNIAERYDPAGESQPQTRSDSSEKVAGDDSSGDGACLTGPQDSLADTESSNQSKSGTAGAK